VASGFKKIFCCGVRIDDDDRKSGQDSEKDKETAGGEDNREIGEAGGGENMSPSRRAFMVD
jgi:hypothetical protein